VKILQISENDIYGHKFNGFDLSKKLNQKNINSSMCVWNKYSSEKFVWKIANFKGRYFINGIIAGLEKRLSVQSLFYINPFFLLFNKKFLKADVIHYHLIHNGFFSLFALPILTRFKPSVWTLHDPWAITGHCIHSFDCMKWKSGCGKCPYLKTHIPLDKDHTAFMWKIKQFIYKHSRLNIIVASSFMLNRVKESSLFKNHKINQIPFGLNINQFKPYNIVNSKKKFSIPKDSIVIFFRSEENEFKGLKYIKEALNKIKSTNKIFLLTVAKKGLLTGLEKKFKIIELGWVVDDTAMINAYNACDMFIMPSTQEAFGLMAVEAMLCGKPVISFSGTSLQEITFAPKGGITVPMGDSMALYKQIIYLIDNPGARIKLGNEARKIACDNYNEQTYINNIVKLYRDISFK